MRIREAQKIMDPSDLDPDADLDPQHWFFLICTRISFRQCFGISAGPDLAAYLNEDPDPGVYHHTGRKLSFLLSFFSNFYIFSLVYLPV
jgi:hypothetical protein